MTTVLLVAVLVGILLGVLRPHANYPTNVWWGKDVTWAAVTGSPRKQTISDFIGDKARSGRWWARALDWLFRGHFSATTEDRERTGFYATSLGMFLGAVVIGGWLYAKWTWPVVAVRLIETPFYALLLSWLLSQLVVRRLARR